MTEIILPNAPDIRGLRFRTFRGEGDHTQMWEISEKEKRLTGDDYYESLEDFDTFYKNLVNCDPFKHLLIATVDDRIIAYSRCWWSEKQQGGYNYNHFIIMDPKWYGKGIAEPMFAWNEAMLKKMALEHPDGETKEFQGWALDSEINWVPLLKASGYRIARYGYEMVRALSEPISDVHLPDGLEIRPVLPEDYRKLWDADAEATKDSWEPVIMAEEWYNNWMGSTSFQPELWRVAWDGERIAGAVQNYIFEETNREYHRLRGYTENIHVGRDWRGKGLAKALIASSFRLLKEKGMTEACLGVDAENPTGALHVYESMGFKVYKTWHTFRKPVFEDK